MFGLITILTPRLGKLAAPLVYGGLVLLAVFALWLYGHHKYKAGEAHSDQLWHDASNRLQAQSVTAAAQAGVQADQRAVTHDMQVSEERNRIADAEQNGASPLDALFN